MASYSGSELHYDGRKVTGGEVVKMAPGMFEWESGFDTNFLMKTFREMRNVSDGKCSFNATDYKFWLPVLHSAVRSQATSRRLKLRSISKALSDPAEKLNNPADFLKRCDSAFSEISAVPTAKFIVLCDVTYEGPPLTRNIRQDSCRIVWAPSETSKFMVAATKARTDIQGRLATVGVPLDVKGLTPIAVHVEALDMYEAYGRAMDALDVFRGLLNLLVNAGRQLNSFAFEHTDHAINRFRLGPYRTVHLPSGQFAGEVFWYEPRWQHSQKSAKFGGDNLSTQNNIARWRRLINNNHLKEFTKQGLIRYCRALDTHDTDPTLLSLWGVLEYLTDTQNQNYDKTIERAAKVGSDYLEVKNIAAHLRLRRNSTIHAAISTESSEAEAVLMHADKLVCQVLFFYITNRPKFKTKKDLVSFLDLEMDRHFLASKGRLIDRFIRYHEKWGGYRKERKPK